MQGRQSAWVLGPLTAVALLAAGCPNELELKRKAETRYRIAEDAYARGDFSTAITELERALDLDRKNPEAHHLMGLYYMIQRSDFANAEKHFKMAIDYYDGSFSKAKNSLGLLYLNAGKVDPAVPLFEEAIADIHYYKDSWAAEGNLGRALAAKGDFEGALTHLDRALGINPRFCAGYFHRAELYAKRDDLERAARDYASASGRDPSCKGFTDAHFRLGEVEAKRGRKLEAAKAYADCAASAPDGERGTDCKTKLRLLCVEEAVRAAMPACAEPGK